MKCPFCRIGDFAVIDTRSQENRFPVRRRRVCSQCRRRVWTTEQIEEVPLKVVKKDLSREPFDRGKLRRGLEKACYKRPLSSEQLEEVIQQVESELYGQYFGEVPAPVIGDMVMRHLRALDQVAYVRFASVYRQFKDASDFVQEVEPMLIKAKKQTGKKKRR